MYSDLIAWVKDFVVTSLVSHRQIATASVTANIEPTSLLNANTSSQRGSYQSYEEPHERERKQNRFGWQVASVISV